jgi:hypothetical protein
MKEGHPLKDLFEILIDIVMKETKKPTGETQAGYEPQSTPDIQPTSKKPRQSKTKSGARVNSRKSLAAK